MFCMILLYSFNQESNDFVRGCSAVVSVALFFQRVMSLCCWSVVASSAVLIQKVMTSDVFSFAAFSVTVLLQKVMSFFAVALFGLPSQALLCK